MSAYLNPMVVYLVGMTLVIALALVFCLSIRYYIKAKDLAPYLHKIDELLKKLAELQSKIDDKDRELKEKLEAVTRAEKSIQQGKDAEVWLKNTQDRITNTQENLARVNADFQQAQSQLQDVQRRVSEKQQSLIDLENKAVEAEQRVKDALKEGEEIRKENAELMVQVPKLRTERDEFKKEIDAKKSELDSLVNEISEKVDSLNNIQAKLAELQALIDVKRKELEKAEEDCQKARQAEHDARIETSKLEGQARQAQSVLSELAAKRENSSEIWKNLDAPVIDEGQIREPDEEFLDEDEWLSTLSQRLKKSGFIFDDRTIRAFHTGLKCAQQTPLVVLAGISGTGKSLLPELYASAFGMNFLPVPVQPRWDSPQDLFGFYNYMEGRYKATELARLLWQFDRYNGPAKDAYDEDNLPLNLVLLDEMNLARVEYYFSDLLSKLETRNGLDLSKPIERKKAEIELECNAADKIDTMRHLFVSPYTLFVGTMNEDESTQTLSDKVIDRSNVLRFGRPKKFDAADGEEEVKEPDKSSFVHSYTGAPRVSAMDWKVWCKSLNDADEDREDLAFLRRTVKPVAEALDKISRPYGYRVDKAMKLYVMNYPGDYREAVADQIEMKILPKLNGVELQDEHFPSVKQAILTAIDATGDERLRKAFEGSCPSGGTFFKWRGVMR